MLLSVVPTPVSTASNLSSLSSEQSSLSESAVRKDEFSDDSRSVLIRFGIDPESLPDLQQIRAYLFGDQADEDTDLRGFLDCPESDVWAALIADPVYAAALRLRSDPALREALAPSLSSDYLRETLSVPLLFDALLREIASAPRLDLILSPIFRTKPAIEEYERQNRDGDGQPPLDDRNINEVCAEADRRAESRSRKRVYKCGSFVLTEDEVSRFEATKSAIQSERVLTYQYRRTRRMLSKLPCAPAERFIRHSR